MGVGLVELAVLYCGDSEFRFHSELCRRRSTVETTKILPFVRVARPRSAGRHDHGGDDTKYSTYTTRAMARVPPYKHPGSVTAGVKGQVDDRTVILPIHGGRPRTKSMRHGLVARVLLRQYHSGILLLAEEAGRASVGKVGKQRAGSNHGGRQMATRHVGSARRVAAKLDHYGLPNVMMDGRCQLGRLLAGDNLVQHRKQKGASKRGHHESA